VSVISPPAPLPIRSIKWTLKQPHQVNRSRWTGRRQVSTLPGGSWWSCTAELRPMIGQAVAQPWIGFFNALQGQVNPFPVIAVEAAQHGGANPTVVLGVAGARSLTLSAAPPALPQGAMMTVKLVDGTYQLVVLTAPIAGTTASFAPALRADAATGAGSVETVLPFAHVALNEDSFTYAVDPGQKYTLAFQAEEAF